MAYKRTTTFASTCPLVKRLSQKTKPYGRSLSEDLQLEQKTESNAAEGGPLKQFVEVETDDRTCESSANTLDRSIYGIYMKYEIDQLLACLKISSPEELQSHVEKLIMALKLKGYKEEIDKAVKKMESHIQERLNHNACSKCDSRPTPAELMKTKTTCMEKTTLHNLCEFRGVPETRITVNPAFDAVLNRLSSLCDFSPGINISLIRMANAGFYKPTKGEGKATKCYSCEAVYDKWKSGDDPMSIHRMLNSSCPIVTEYDNFQNVPLPPMGTAGRDNTARNIAETVEVSATARNYNFPNANSGLFTSESKANNTNSNVQTNTESTREISTSNNSSSTLEEDQHGQAVTAGQGEQSADFETLGIFVDKPKYPNYAPIQARISSYNGWPSYLDQTARQMSEAGFLYAGYNDYTRCFSCGGGLRNWEAGDDPWVEHARWFPKCSYLRQNKGDTFITIVQKKHQETLGQQNSSASNNNATKFKNNSQPPVGSPNSKPRISDRSNLLSSNSGNGAKNVAISPNEVGNRQGLLQAVAARSVLEMGYKDEEVLVALDQLRRYGKDESSVSATDIMHVLLGDEIEVSSNSATVVAPANSTSGESSPQNGAVASLDDTELLLEENRQLKDQRLCKVCLDLDATIAFLPCGHIVCCKDCAPAMRKCPVCRTHVKGTVKTYLA